MGPIQTQSAPLTADARAAIDEVLAAHQSDPTQLVGVLLDAQEKLPGRCISQSAAVYVAAKLGLKITQVYDVISFYTALHDTPRAKYPLEVCKSAPCHVNGSESLTETLEGLLGIGMGETTPDGRFSLERVPCFGACDVAPAVRCNGVVYGGLTSPDKVAAMLAQMA